MTDLPNLHQTAQARRLYHHFTTGGTLSEWDMSRMVSYIEVRDTRIEELEEALRECSAANRRAFKRDENFHKMLGAVYDVVNKALTQQENTNG